ncbi:GM24267 [Drosophila sechellia]|uniref:GM24267 n=1 Tax=Drosophila sechellia TaxID=7238 RepID=B4HLH0_DROSE|nr:GM24267 [Drosophila sechellia]
MCTGKEYLELASFFAQAKPPKPQELRPCNQHEILLQLICNRRQSLSKSQMADLLWNLTTGPKKKHKRRQCGGMDDRNRSEPTDIEVVKKERECGKSTIKDAPCEKHSKNQDQAGGRKKDKHKKKTRTKRKLPGCWALLPFGCGLNLAHDSSCQDVPHRRDSS